MHKNVSQLFIVLKGQPACLLQTQQKMSHNYCQDWDFPAVDVHHYPSPVDARHFIAQKEEPPPPMLLPVSEEEERRRKILVRPTPHRIRLQSSDDDDDEVL